MSRDDGKPSIFQMLFQEKLNSGEASAEILGEVSRVLRCRGSRSQGTFGSLFSARLGSLSTVSDEAKIKALKARLHEVRSAHLCSRALLCWSPEP